MEPARTDGLLADLRWLRSLARRLAADDDAADDAVQDTAIAALQHGAAVAHPRAWLATVLRNCLRLRLRSERAAAAREARAADPERLEPTAELVQRAELQQRLCAAVLALPAHYRDVVLLRFFDEEPPRAIATRLRLPVATVHSRLQRALQLLRGDLDRACGNRAAWAAVLLPAPTWSLFPVVAGVLMQTKLKIGAAALLIAGGVTWFWPEGAAGTTELQPPVADQRGRDGSSGGGAGGGSPGSTPSQRQALPGRAAAPADGVARVQVRGRVCDTAGTGLGNVSIGVRGDTAAASRSDAGGEFVFELVPRPVAFVCTDPTYVTVLAASWEPASRLLPVLVLAPQQTIAGRVVDTAGAPVAGAQVVVQTPEDLHTRVAVPLDRAERQRWNVRTAADGSFRLPRVPRLDGSSLWVGADAYRPLTRPLPPVDDEQLLLVLERFAYEEGQLTGVVVDPTGTPVAGALVTMGVTSVVSDDAGKFGVLLRRAGWPTAIVGAKAGYLPGRVEVPATGGARPDEWPARIVLQLGVKPMSLRGRVLDQDGKGVAGAIVWVTDPTLHGIVNIVPIQLEYLLAGGEVPRQAARMRSRFADDPTKDGHFTDQASNVEEPTAAWFFATADEQGDFEVPGLLPRDYTLRALDVRTGVTGDAVPTPAGAFAEIRITRSKVWPVLRGRVVSQRGEPMPDCTVQVRVLAFRTNERVPGGRFEGQALREGAHVRTGADGAFELRDVGSEHAFLAIAGEAILPRSLQCAEVGDPTQVKIEVEARCHVEVALSNPQEADEIAARDAAGEGVDLVTLRANSNSFETELKLHEGRSGVFVLSERARTLLLVKAGKVVREVPLQLRPGETFKVQ